MTRGLRSLLLADRFDRALGLAKLDIHSWFQCAKPVERRVAPIVAVVPNWGAENSRSKLGG